MGRPYAEELDRMSEVYQWAVQAQLGDLVASVRATSALALVAVGSGGSYTTAEFAAAIHRSYSSGGASVMTPLDAISTPQSLRQAAVLLATAGGRNPDVVGAFERLTCREPRHLLVLCARQGSPLVARSRKYPFVHFAEFEPPTGKDGFLATNSLLASVVVLARAYAASFNAAQPLPEALEHLLPEASAGAIYEKCLPLWQHQSLVVLYGPSCRAAAVDLESKFSEAALGAIQLADFRNFAHGRHHWLAKRGGETGVLALVTDQDRDLADGTLSLIPKKVPVARLDIDGEGLRASLCALLQVFTVVGSAGRARNIDPGDPGVPSFGRKIYHLRAFSADASVSTARAAREAAALERKSGATVATLAARGAVDVWRTHYNDFCKALTKARFCGLVLDYDGTLCNEADRFDPLSEVVSSQLNRLLRAGAILGVATGRGKSVKESLRRAIRKPFWDRVVVGYYNGGDVALLDCDQRPDGTDGVGTALQPLATVLKETLAEPGLAKLTFRIPQITIEPGPQTRCDDLWSLLQNITYAAGIPGVSVVRSSHSMDVVAPGVTKRTVIDKVQELANSPDGAVLCVGDRGRWPGNDYALLSGPHSLSVDEVSSVPSTCWNLAIPGCRGAAAAIVYLRSLKKMKDGLKFFIE